MSDLDQGRHLSHKYRKQLAARPSLEAMNVEMVETVEKPMPDEQARRQVSEMRDVHVVPSAGITLDESQRQALAIISRSAIAVLTGGPGTGKTTITKQVVSRRR